MLAVYLQSGQISVDNIPKPVRPAGFALLRLLAGGICNTDLELQRGYYGFSGIPGHEFVAEVADADDQFWIGRRVAGEINLACRDCPTCRQGLGRHCSHRTVLGIVRHPGAFQEFFTLPEANLHEIPDSIPTATAVFIEPLAAACEILDQVSIPCGETVAVLGDGKLGLLISMVLNAHGYPVHQYGRHEAKLRIAGDVGVSTRLASETLPTAEYSVVVEATGSSEGLRTAAVMTRPRGTLVLKSTVHGSVPVDTAPIVVNEITVIGSRCGRFEAALPLLDHHLIPVERLISARYPLAEAVAAFACAASPGVMKVLLEAVPSK